MGRQLGALALALGAAACGGPTADRPPAAVSPEPVPPTRSIEISLLAEVPPAEVVRLWSTADGVRSFLAPAANIAGEVGGPFEIVFEPETDPEGAHHGTSGATLLALEPGWRVAFTWTFPPFGPEFNTRPFPTWVEVTAEAMPDRPGHSIVHFAHHGFPLKAEWDRVYEMFRDGNWPLVLNRFVVFCRDGLSPDWDGEGDRFDRFLAKDRTVPASVAEVWHAWSTPDGLTGFLDAPARVVLGRGGPYEVYFAPDAPAGQRGGEGCFVVDFAPERSLTFTWNAPPSFPAVRREHTVVTVQLEPAGDGVTHLRFLALGWGTGDEWVRAHGYFDAAWDWVLDALVAHYAGDRTGETDER
jgi:uncharacterized protein YndB with AHSA1/START domain